MLLHACQPLQVGNLRYSRLGSLRYGSRGAASEFVAQTALSAVSPAASRLGDFGRTVIPQSRCAKPAVVVFLNYSFAHPAWGWINEIPFKTNDLRLI